MWFPCFLKGKSVFCVSVLDPRIFVTRRRIELPPPTALSDSVSLAMDALRVAMINDPEYAWGWHCNIAMAAQDEGLERIASQRAANRFMERCFKVTTWPSKIHPEPTYRPFESLQEWFGHRDRRIKYKANKGITIQDDISEQRLLDMFQHCVFVDGINPDGSFITSPFGVTE